MMILALIGAAMIGLTLGLLGSGGSILTVPILVYLLGKDGKIAITESLAIVGGIAAIGAIPHARAKNVRWMTAILFGIPGMAGAYLGSIIGGYLPGALQLVIFAIVMLTAAWFMLRKSARKPSTPTQSAPARDTPAVWLVVLEGFAVGIMTGLVGVGGGFLIVPSLVLLAGLSMHHAVGTSLVIIVLNSFAAFFRYQTEYTIDWRIIGIFIVIGGLGTLAGKVVGSRIDQRSLKRIFAYFLIVMGLIMVVRESVRLATEPEETSATAEGT